VRRSALVAAAIVAVVTGPTGCRSSPASSTPEHRSPSVTTEVVQLRRDYVLHRVEVSVHNRSAGPITVERLRLTVEGFQLPGWLRFDAPLPAGQTVNLPVPFRGTACPASGEPSIGTPRVVVQISDGNGEHRIDSRAAVPYDMLKHLASRDCTVKRVTHDVSLSFGDQWTLRHTASGDELTGVLRVRLLHGGDRRIMQLIGANMYALRPQRPPADPETPLAVVTPERPAATIPVIARAGRCDGHTKGEIKQPYEFLVWVAHSTDSGVAITPRIGAATKSALRQVCAF
jgi:hypothetical protein